jgi:hypothetical protein
MATPFERIKAAWDSSDREGELNRVVEVMAAEDVTREDLDDALARLLSAARTAGADDETEEIINCVGDRLHGWGNAKYHIATRTRSTPADPTNGHAAPSDTPAANTTNDR